MIRQAPRYLLRQCQSPILPSVRHFPRQTRFASTSPPAQRPRSWRSFLVRGGLAVGVVYYYNTSKLFAEEPAYAVPPSQTAFEEETALPTLDSLIAPRAAEAPVPTLASQPYVSQNAATSDSVNTASTALIPSSAQPGATTIPPSSSATSKSSLQYQNTQHHDEQPPASHPESLEPQDPQDLEDSAHSEGAFNEATGEINWDCPCLGGMAHGTCGTHFRAAFSCFVFSKEEPKGMDCIDKFKEMQGCFREHPEEYGAELEDDGGDDDDDELYNPDDGAVAGAEQARLAQGRGIETGDTATMVEGQTKYPSGEPLPEAAERGVRDAENVTIASDKRRSLPSSATAAATTTSPISPASEKAVTGATAGGKADGGAPPRRAKATKSQSPAQQRSEVSSGSDADDDLVPKAAHDARGAQA